MNRNEKLGRIAAFCGQAAGTSDSGQLLDDAATLVKSVFDCRSVAVMMIDENTRQLCVRSSAGLPPSVAQSCRRVVGTMTLADVLLAGTSLRIERVEPGGDIAREFTLEHEPVSLVCVRLAVDNRPIGCILCESDRPNAFDEEDLTLLRLVAPACAVSVDRDRLCRVSRKLTMTDPLTQIYSYGYFHRRFLEEAERARRLNQPVSLLLLDVDRLEEFRKAHGLQPTEKALRDIVALVTGNVRNIDVAGRYGVDQLILYLPSTPREKALVVAERLRGAIESAVQPVEEPKLTVSVGIASSPEDGDSAHGLLNALNRALLTAQRAGPNRVASAAEAVSPV
jgi:diguanylate cyclase (GGDEF)-like protein